MTIVFTNPMLIALGVMVGLSYFVRWRILLGLSAIGIFLYAYSISATNIPFSILAFLFGVATLIYAFARGGG